MRRTCAFFIRIMRQTLHDKRTIALILFAPLIILYLVYSVLNGDRGNLFDQFGAQLIGVIVYFFVFLIAGINFLTERTSGTLEKVLSTSVRRHEIVLGYIGGYSLLTLLQCGLVTLFVIYVCGLDVKGSIGYVFLIAAMTAVNALTFGILLSTVANSEFQMVQFIPLVIMPQVFLCGLFPLSDNWAKVSHLLPLYYTSHAMTSVILEGNGFSDIRWDLLLLLSQSILFAWLNTLLLKRQRSL